MSIISRSHKSSILSTARTVRPLPQNTSLYLPFNEHPYDVTRNIYPINDPVYTTVKTGGPFNKGFTAIEEQTDNLFVNGDFSNGVEGWTNTGNSEIVKTPDGPLPQAIKRVFTAGGTVATQSYISDTEITGSIALSWWTWGSRDRGIRYYIRFYEENGTQILGTNTNYSVIGNEWTRYSKIFDVPPLTYSIQIHLNASSSTGTPEDPLTVMLTGFQLENKNFPTSFVNGSRPVGELIYDIPSTDKFTIASWVRALHGQPFTETGGTATTIYGRNNTSTKHQIRFSHHTQTSWLAPGTSDWFYTRWPTDTDVGDWCLFVWKWTSDWRKVYIFNPRTNTENFREGQLAPGSKELINNIRILGRRDMAYSDLFVLPYIATDEEVRSWCYSGSPPHDNQDNFTIAT